MGKQPHAQIEYDRHVETLRRVEYPSLTSTTYLDHAGTTLYPSSLIDAYHQDLKSSLYGNPHSDSPASDLSTQRVDEARLAVLRYFNADPNHFDVIFTANATAAIKLVADCFRDQNFWYGFHKDAHSSVVGVREVARLGSRCFVSNEDVENWIDERSKTSKASNLTLFAYPAQSNMTGYRPPYSWSSQIRNSSNDTDKQRTYVLLDAASYLTSGRLDLHQHRAAPDFIALSFYKIFGFPDLGALIVRKTAHDVLTRRRYFGGGTVDQVTVIDATYHAKKTHTIHDFLEDGTLPFHNIVALSHAINIHDKLFGSAQAIAKHVSFVSAHIFQRLTDLKHFNNTRVIQFHKDPLGTYGDSTSQGPILAFSLLRSDGTFVGKSHFERLAIDCGFQLRTGGVCNPGGIASMLGLSHWELRRNFTEGARCGGDIDVVGGKPTGIIRISLGPMSTLSDVKRFAEFVECFFVEKPLFGSAWNVSSGSPKRPAVPKTITPIDNCGPVTFDNDSDAMASQTWNAQWCVVEPKAGGWRPVESVASLSTLGCTLHPEKGVFGVTQRGKPDLVISLWTRPEEDATVCSSCTTRAYDVYSDQHIASWLSLALGFPCTLARYRGEDAKTLPEACTCQVQACNIRFPTRSDLNRHYKLHAASFLKTHSFQSCDISDERGPSTDVEYPSYTKHRLSWMKKRASSEIFEKDVPPSPSTSTNSSYIFTEKTELLRKSKKPGKKSFMAKILSWCS